MLQFQSSSLFKKGPENFYLANDTCASRPKWGSEFHRHRCPKRPEWTEATLHTFSSPPAPHEAFLLSPTAPLPASRSPWFSSWSVLHPECLLCAEDAHVQPALCLRGELPGLVRQLLGSCLLWNKQKWKKKGDCDLCVNASISTFCPPPDPLRTLGITTPGFCWDLLRGWRTKEPPTSYPANPVTPGSGTAVTGIRNHPASVPSFFGEDLISRIAILPNRKEAPKVFRVQAKTFF